MRRELLALALLLATQWFCFFDSSAFSQTSPSDRMSLDTAYMPSPLYDVSVVEVTGIPQWLRIPWFLPPGDPVSSGIAVADIPLVHTLRNSGADVRVLAPYDERETYYLIRSSPLLSENVLSGIGKVLWRSDHNYLISTPKRLGSELATFRARARPLSPFDASLASMTPDVPPPSLPLEYSPVERFWIEQMVNSVSEADLLKHICVLSGEIPVSLSTGLDTLLTRYSYHPNCLKAAEYLYSQFDSVGVEVAYDPFLGVRLKWVEFVSSEGYVVGDYGIIYHTKDGGNTWEKQVSGTDIDLWKVSSVSGDAAWVIGPAGTLLKTTNSGSDWVAVNTGIGLSMFGVEFLNANLGWMCGGGGIITNTTDGGWSWTTQRSGLPSILYDIDFADSLNGWAVGTVGTILHTSDGGTTWAFQESGVRDRLYDVCFVDSLYGWAVGNGGTVLNTMDGGTYWRLQAVPTVKSLYSVCFVDTLKGWAVGRDGLVLSTRDGGTRWQIQTTGISNELGGVDFVSGTQGWVVGYRSLLGTLDGGSSWFSMGHKAPDAWRNVVATLEGTESPSEIYIVCAHYDSISDDPMVRAPGADDNASGTSLVVEAAEILKDYEFESTIKFICLSGEELGLYGSDHYARSARSRGEDIKAVLNFDMIAWGSMGIYFVGNLPSSPVADYCIAVRDSFVPGFHITKTIDPALRYSDHASFWDAGYYALCGIEIDHESNRFLHTKADVVHRLDMHLAGEVTRLAVASLASLAGLAATPMVAATVDVDPNTLNLKSNGNYVTCYIELPSVHPVTDIDVSTVLLNGSVGAESKPYSVGDYDCDEVPDLMVKFDRERVQQVLTAGDSVEVVVTGEASGLPFEGKDAIRVIGDQERPGREAETVSVAGGASGRYELCQNYPDPFNPRTVIRYQLPVSSDVSLRIFNVTGKLVRTLVDEHRSAGQHLAVWNGESQAGVPVPSGVYFYTIKTRNFTDTKKMIVLR